MTVRVGSVAARLLLALVLLAPMATATAAAPALGGGRVAETENVRAELLAEVAAVAPGTTFWVALRLDIRDGWHTYWRNPGDSGEPTRIRWSLSDGVVASDIHWPFPERIPYAHLVNFGYHGRVLLLVEMTVDGGRPPGSVLEATADVSWLACKDICIPEAATLRLSLPVTAGPAAVDAAAAAEIDRGRALLPVASPWPARFAVDDRTLTLELATGAAGGAITAASLFPYEWGAIEPSAAQHLTVADGRLVLTTDRGEAVPQALNGVLVIAERSGDATLERAVEIAAVRVEAIAATPVAAEGAIGGIAAALGFAFLGGLILNLMPCVFPVLSIKAIGIVGHGVRSSGHLRASGLAYTAGVLAFMALVGGVLLALKGVGAEVGWGFQLQSPAFVAVMAVLLFTLGLSLSGWFFFGAAIMGWGAGIGARSEGVGSFVTGALAALVATPCTAPFMGAAIGFALAQPAPVALAVMLALGLGLAVPYLLITWVPGLAGRLPRPGAWMERLKQLLAFPLYAAAAWLVWVLALQAGPSGVLAALAAMIFVAFAIWLWQATRGGGRRSRVAGSIGAAAAVVAAAALAVLPEALPPAAAGRPEAPHAGSGLMPEPFSPERLARLRADGTPVFVNMTAAWCITCKVNEQVALSSERVARAFADGGIVYLEGDWTNRDAAIGRYLRDYGRSGVPLYVLYKPTASRPQVLPQFLTEAIVLDAIRDLADRPLSRNPEQRS
ncbi:MAG: protein-disulfide reductase DsbD family protein [Rhodospirillales bacterium]